MSIFYDTLEGFKDFSSRVDIKIKQYLPEFSLFENIISSYDKTLADSQKIENKNYIEIKNKLELLNQEIKARQDVKTNLTPLLLDFEDTAFPYIRFNLQNVKRWERGWEIFMVESFFICTCGVMLYRRGCIKKSKF